MNHSAETRPDDEFVPVRRSDDSRTTGALEDALARVDWSPKSRGVLLAVAPGHPSINGRVEWFEPVRPGLNGRFDVDVLARGYGRKIARFGPITALVPTRRGTLAVTDDDSDYVEILGRSQLFLSSLRPEQWRAVGENRGAGFDAFSEAQRFLLRRHLPEPMSVETRGRVFDPAKNPYVNVRATDCRLRIRWRVRVVLVEEGGGPWGAHDDPGEDKAPVRFVSYPFTSPTPPENPLFPIIENVAREPLPRLSGGVALDSAATVGELVARCAKAAGAPLGVDIRLGEKRVFLSHTPDQTVDAGDLLAALALSLGAVVRSSDDSGEPWLWLVDDSETYASRARRHSARTDAARVRWNARLGVGSVTPGRPRAFYRGDEISPALAARIRALPWTARSTGLALRELPERMRVDARRAIARTPPERYSVEGELGMRTRKIRTDRAQPYLSAWAELILPGGTIAVVPGLDVDRFLYPARFRPARQEIPRFPEATPQRRAAFRKRFGVDPLDLALPGLPFPSWRTFFNNIGDNDNLNRRLIDAWRTS